MSDLELEKFELHKLQVKLQIVGLIFSATLLYLLYSKRSQENAVATTKNDTVFGIRG